MEVRLHQRISITFVAISVLFSRIIVSDYINMTESKMTGIVNENEESSSQTVGKQKLTSAEVEKLEEAKLKAKYPIAAGGALSGHSAFLQKKLAKGQKYFDSGDYQMARQSRPSIARPTQMDPVVLNFGTGEAIPTPESVPVRKTSIIQPKFHPAVAAPPTSNS